MRGSPVTKKRIAIFLTIGLSGCTAVVNDINRGIEYGSNQELITRKIDERKKPGWKPGSINAFLWRAALDTVGTIPLVTADSRTGVILTDWHSAPSDAGERTQLKIEVLDDELRRDTLRVSVARQVLQDGNWVAAPAQTSVAHNLEEAILTKARDLR